MKKSIEAINELPADVRKQSLEEQCKDKSDQPFCDQDFISGKSSFDDVLKKKTKEQTEPVFIQALDNVRNQLAVFSKFPLVLISIISAILGIVFYMLAQGTLKGFQIFSGNIAWLSFLSAISFKFMPGVLEKAVSAMQQNVPVGSEGVSLVMKSILFSWLTPAIDDAFMFSIYLTIISFVIWIGIKFYRKYYVVDTT